MADRKDGKDIEPTNRVNRQAVTGERVAQLYASRGFAWLVFNLVKRVEIEEPDERIVHVRVCGGGGR